jgi:hypothetical protein
LFRVERNETNRGLQRGKRIAGRDCRPRICQLPRLDVTVVSGQRAQPELASGIRDDTGRRCTVQRHRHVRNWQVAAVITDLTAHGERVRRGIRKGGGKEK